MPRVPDILPGVGASPSRVGGFSAPEVVQGRDFTGQQLMQLGRAAEQAGQEWGRLGEQQQAEMDEAKVFEAVNATEEGDIKEESSFRNLAGKAAGDGFEPFMKSAQERRRKVLESAENERQRLMMERALTRTMTDLSRRGMAHRDAQVKEFQAAEVLTGIGSSGTQYSQAVVNGDEEGATTHYNTMIARALKLAEIRGLPAGSEIRKALVQGATTDAHKQVVSAMMAANRSADAATYFADNRLDIAEGERAGLEVVVKRGVQRDTAYSLATTALQSANGDPFKAQESLQQLFNAKEIDSNMLDMAEQRVMRMATMEANQREVENAQVVTNAEQWLAAPENRGRPLSDNPELYESVAKAGKLPQLLSFQDKGRYTNNNEVLGMLGSLSDEQMASVSPEAFHGMVHGNLTPSQEAFWKAKHRAANGRASKADRTILTMEERITKGAIDAKVLRVADPNAMTEDESVRFEVFKAKVDDNLQKWQTKNHREPSDHEITTEIIDPLVADQVVLNGEKRSVAYLNRDELGESFLVVPGRAKPLYLRDIPPARIDEIVRKWNENPRLRGKTPTWESVGRAYAMMLAQGLAQEGESMEPINYSELPSQFRLMPTIKPPRKHSIARGLAFPY